MFSWVLCGLCKTGLKFRHNLESFQLQVHPTRHLISVFHQNNVIFSIFRYCAKNKQYYVVLESCISKPTAERKN